MNACWNSVSAVGGSQVPAGCARSFHEPFVEVLVHDVEVALREQRRVVVGRRAAHDDELRRLDLPRLDAADHALTDQLADVDVVERDVVLAARGSTERQAVVVDRLDAGRGGELLRLGAGRRVLGVDADDLGSGRDVRLDVRDERRVAALGVLDVDLRRLQAGVLQRHGQHRRVELRVAGGGRRVGQDHGDRPGALRGQRYESAHRRVARREVLIGQVLVGDLGRRLRRRAAFTRKHRADHGDGHDRRERDSPQSQHFLLLWTFSLRGQPRPALGRRPTRHNHRQT